MDKMSFILKEISYHEFELFSIQKSLNQCTNFKKQNSVQNLNHKIIRKYLLSIWESSFFIRFELLKKNLIGKLILKVNQTINSSPSYSEIKK